MTFSPSKFYFLSIHKILKKDNGSHHAAGGTLRSSSAGFARSVVWFGPLVSMR